MDEPDEQADNLCIAAEKLRAMACLPGWAKLNEKQRRQKEQMQRRVEKLIYDLVTFYDRTGIPEPTYDQVEKFR